uniref:Lpa3 n=1 Tax=Arundo donax TaxID=35708 RepID=A0A0A9CPR7_ARUDO
MPPPRCTPPTGSSGACAHATRSTPPTSPTAASPTASPSVSPGRCCRRLSSG